MGSCHLFSGLFGREHPVDLSLAVVSLPFPCRDPGLERFPVGDAAAETPALQNAGPDLDHAGPAGVLRSMVKPGPTQDSPSLRRRKGARERGRGMRRQIVRHHPDPVGIGKVHVAQLPHAVCKVGPGPPASEPALPPGIAGIEENEEVGGSAPPVLVVVASGPA